MFPDRIRALCLAIALLLVNDATGSPSYADLVEANFPSHLTTYYQQLYPGSDVPRDSAFVIADMNGDEVEEIIAAYSNSLTSELLLMDLAGSVLYALTSDQSAPIADWVDVEAHDFDGDGDMEVVLTTKVGATGGTPHEHWIYDWDGSSLALLSGFSLIGDLKLSAFVNAIFVDLDGDGKTEVIQGEGNVGHIEGVIYSQIGSSFAKTKQLAFDDGYPSFAGFPGVVAANFEAPDTSSEYRLIIGNGVGGEKRANAASLTLNGQAVLAAGEINETVDRVQKNVTLQSFNVLGGQFQGDPDAFLRITIDRPVPVPPIVDIGPDATSTAGAVFVRSGSFLDPDSSSWTGVVDFDEGLGEETIALSAENTFELSNVYETAGVYTIEVTITDDNSESGSANFTLSVQEPEVIPPNNLTARRKQSQIQLVWTHNGSDSYNVYRSESAGGPYTLIANTTSTYSTYLDTGLTIGTTYFYVVTSVLSGVESAHSAEVSTTL